MFSICSNTEIEVTSWMVTDGRREQREVIRLWNRLRKVEGPAAEELRIQILEFFGERGHAKRSA